MNFFLICCLAVASLSIFPTKTQCAPEKRDLEPSVGEIWQEDDHEVLIRNERGTKNGSSGGIASGKRGNPMKLSKKQEKQKDHLSNEKQMRSCRYAKSAWTECDPKTNQRSRTLTLKKGEDGCVQTRTIQKKCKKACRYEKGAWSECIGGKMSRSDKLKATSDAACESTRLVNKNCNPGKNSKGGAEGGKKEQRQKNIKDKAGRKGRV
uniref:Putative conserved secreted protein n=1 Tax=Nyssomyia neivai TaxID=330878 RepID=A0A1L8DPB3_9DIPT